MCIVLNAKDICVTGRKLTDKVYYGHTGYIGHLKERTLKDQMAKDPTEVIHKVVLRMVPKNKLRDASAGIREVHFLPFNPEQIMILWNLREDAERKVHAIIDEFAERGLRSPAVAKQDSPMRGPAQQFLTLRAFGALPIVIALAAQGTFRGFKDTKTPLYAVGGLLIGRTLAVFITIRLTTSEAAKLGPIPMAGHEICMQVWLSISLLTDALALAGQTLLASSYSMGNYEQARLIIYRVIQIGLGAGITLSLILFFGFGAFASLFSTDSEVLDVSRSGILFVAGSQPVNALAFVIDGIYYGVSDFEYAAYSMVLVGLVSSIFLVVAAPVLGLPGVWTGLFIFMALRVLAGVWRLSSKSGPWDMIWYKDEQKTD